MSDIKASKRGGKREGAGRKAARGATKVMRIPEQYEQAVKELIQHMDDQRGKAAPQTSRLAVRDLDDRRVLMAIKTMLP